MIVHDGHAYRRGIMKRMGIMKTVNWTVLVWLSVGVAGQCAAEDVVSEYRVYGQAHLSLEYLDDGSASSEYLSNNGSRLGFKGNVTLSEALSMMWQIETGVELDEGGRKLATRNSYAGLGGPWGKIIAGRYDSPYKQTGRKADMFGYRLGDSRNIIGINDCGCDLRLNNVVMYTTPKLKGLTAQVARTTRDEAVDTEVTSLNAVYTTKSLLIGAAYEEHGKMLSPIDSDGDGETDSPSPDREAGIRIVGSLKSGGVKIAGLYEELLNVGGTSGSDRVSWGGGISYAVQKAVLRAQYYATDGVDGQPNTGSAMYAVGCDYKLDDRTVAYVSCAMTENEAAAAHRMSGGAHGEKVTPVAGGDPFGVAVGLIHNF
jgi:predicted porin